MTGLRQGNQIGKSSSRALGAPSHKITTFIKILDKDMIGLGRGTQTVKSRAIEAPRHEIHSCIKRIDVKMIGFAP